MLEVRCNHNRRTCIVVSLTKAKVQYIPLSIQDGLTIRELPKEEFEKEYQLLEGYPMDRAAELYLNFGRHVGASHDVMDHLSKVITVTKRDIEVATTRQQNDSPEKTPTKKKTQSKSQRRASGNTTSPPKPKSTKPKAKSTPAKKKQPKLMPKGQKAPSAAQRFRDLIMEGKLTDDEIFTKVQEEFGLDDNKRAYVKWYRNNLKKKGMNPPEAINN